MKFGTSLTDKHSAVPREARQVNEDEHGMAGANPRITDSEEAVESAQTPAKSSRGKIVGVIAGVMLLEGVGVFAAMKMIGVGPEAGHAQSLEVASQPAPQIAEVEVVRVRVPNVKEGKLVLWAMEVVIRTNQQDAEMIAEMIHANEKTIMDRLGRIIRSAEPRHLKEDGLETIRRQVKYELGLIFGDDSKVVEVLIPECTPYPTGF